MFNLAIYGIVCLIFTLFLYIFLIINKNKIDKENNRAFECGLDPIGRPRLPFCMKFFLVGVIFLIFDVEISLILPLPISGSFILLFLSLLVSGLIYE